MGFVDCAREKNQHLSSTMPSSCSQNSMAAKNKKTYWTHHYVLYPQPAQNSLAWSYYENGRRANPKVSAVQRVGQWHTQTGTNSNSLYENFVSVIIIFCINTKVKQIFIYE